MAKRILLVLLMLAVVVGVGFAIYFMFFRVPPTEVVPPEEVVTPPVSLQPAAPGAPGAVVTPTAPAVLPAASPVAQGGLTQVTPVAEAPTVGASITPTGAVSFYNKYDEKFYHMNPDGTVSSLSNVQFHNVQNATFNPNGDQAILEFPDSSKIYYNFATSQQVTLPKHWESFDWSPDGQQIEAKSLGIDVTNRFLVVSNPDGSQARAVQDLGNNADKVIADWSPNNQIIATATTGQSFGVAGKEVFLIGKNHENFRSMVVDGLGFQPKWAPSGQQMLYSAANADNDWKPQLWIVDAAGDDIGNNRRSLNIDTWANKCTFADDSTLYCAVPNQLDRGAGIAASLYDTTPDTIFKIDVNTGLQTKIAEPEGGRTVDKMMVSPDGKYLYFTDKSSGFLEKIVLKQ